jgi:uncharacterized protein YlxW (UPF0749 family)
MTPVKLLKVISFPIVVSQNINLTKAPEVISGVIQSGGTIFAALLTVLIPVYIQERRVIQERKKSSQLDRKNKELDREKEDLNKELSKLNGLISEIKPLLQALQERPEFVTNQKLKNVLSQTVDLINTESVEIGRTHAKYRNAYLWLKKREII